MRHNGSELCGVRRSLRFKPVKVWGTRTLREIPSASRNLILTRPTKYRIETAWEARCIIRLVPFRQLDGRAVDLHVDHSFAPTAGVPRAAGQGTTAGNSPWDPPSGCSFLLSVMPCYPKLHSTIEWNEISLPAKPISRQSCKYACKVSQTGQQPSMLLPSSIPRDTNSA